MAAQKCNHYVADLFVKFTKIELPGNERAENQEWADFIQKLRSVDLDFNPIEEFFIPKIDEFTLTSTDVDENPLWRQTPIWYFKIVKINTNEILTT